MMQKTRGLFELNRTLEPVQQILGNVPQPGPLRENSAPGQKYDSRPPVPNVNSLKKDLDIAQT